MRKIIRIWDLPTRVFHWLLTIVIAGSIISIQLDATELHSKFGYAACILVIFRIVWGFVGPTYARFTNFIPSLAQLKAFIQHPVTQQPGHNPLGAISVVAILLVILTQALTGLFTDDDITFQGPLAKYVSSDLSGWLTSWHDFNANLVYGLIGLHIVAILYYLKFKQQDLITPMVTGEQTIEEVISSDRTSEESKELTPILIESAKDHAGIRGLAFGILVMITVGFYYLVIKK